MAEETGEKIGGYVSFPATPDRSPSSGGPRPARRVVLFAGLFLSVAFFLMAGYRLATTTRANQTYLYLVASHTNGLLHLVGQSTELERPKAFAGREAEVRSALKSWTGREGPDTIANNAQNPQPPLSPWELYRYRLLKTLHELKTEQEYLRMLGPFAGGVAHSRQEHTEIVRQRLSHVERAVERPSPSGYVKVGPPEVLQTISELRAKLDELSAGATVDFDAFVSTLTAMEVQIDGLRLAQAAFLQDRIDRFRQGLKSAGPCVYFVAGRSWSERLQTLKARCAVLDLKRGRRDKALALQKAFLHAQMERLDRKRLTYVASGNPTAFDRVPAFTFFVVSDCGAIEAISIFIAAVLAFPCAWRKRAAGILAGVPVLYGVNIVRLACLAYIGAADSDGQFFRFAHEYVWQGVYVIFVAGVWLVWIELLVKRTPARETQAA